MTEQQEKEIERLKASARVVSTDGAVLRVRHYGISDRVAKSIGQALRAGKKTPASSSLMRYTTEPSPSGRLSFSRLRERFGMD